MRAIVWTFLSAAACCVAQSAGAKIGVLPFSDATATGGANIGETLGRATQAEIVHSTRLEGRVILLPPGTKAEQLDSQKILALGHENNVDLIVFGTVLTAQVEQSNHSGSGPAIFGQSVGVGTHSTKATVTLQADLYDVAAGRKLDSLRFTDSQSDRKVSGNVMTTLGSMNTGGADFQNSTLGKALQKVIAEMVKRVEGEASKIAPRP